VLPFAEINFGEALLVAFEVFFFVIWIWILITILTDLNELKEKGALSGEEFEKAKAKLLA